jgi:hypothetical protein
MIPILILKYGSEVITVIIIARVFRFSQDSVGSASRDITLLYRLTEIFLDALGKEGAPPGCSFGRILNGQGFSIFNNVLDKGAFKNFVGRHLVG